jgi:hypothetical protein
MAVESFETGYALKELSLAGVEVWLYLEDRKFDLDDPNQKFLL